MDLFSIIFYLGIYYVRPHDWIHLFKMLPIIKVTFLMLILTVYHKNQGQLWKQMLRTPHDWLMFFYMLWIIFTSGQPYTTFKLIYSLFAIYFLTVVTLNTTKKIQTLLNWWTVWIVVLAAFAVASKFGFDPTGSYDLTMGLMKGRLAFNTSIFNNANALGHSIVPAIVMLYFIAFWQRPVFIRITTGALMAIPLYCVYATESKGAFLTGATILLVAVTFRRPIIIQILIFVFSLTVGVAAVQLLPRMQELESAKSNEAIQGRVAAFHFGMDSMKSKVAGVGWGRFEISLYKELRFWKAPHSSYVRVGGEMGWIGLAMFLGLMYCCCRTLLFARTDNDDEERIRRTLFVILVSFAVSSWMVGWNDRVIFFLMVAATGAFHRCLIEKRIGQSVAETSGNQFASISSPQPSALPAVTIAPPLTLPTPPPIGNVATPNNEILVTTAHSNDQDHKKTMSESAEELFSFLAGIKWNRLGIVDIVLIALITQATVYFWQYIMTKM